MKLVIGVIVLNVVFFTDPVELVWRSREGPSQVRPDPIRLEIYFCEISSGRPSVIVEDFVKAVVDETNQYIIGIIQGNRVCPLLVQKLYRDPRYPGTELVRYQQVKVQLGSGPVANVAEEIKDGDPLKNKFWKSPRPSSLIDVEIPSL